jgi:hypothetical protein
MYAPTINDPNWEAAMSETHKVMLLYVFWGDAIQDEENSSAKVH